MNDAEVWKIQVDNKGPSLICKEISEFMDLLEEMDEGDCYTIKKASMPLDELNNLPDFEGF